MLISRTPLRISFAGGGTDLEDYYKTGYGAVTSTAIDRYIYVAVNPKFDDKIRASYSKTELVDTVDGLEHGIMREALKLAGVRGGIEIATIADIPSGGTGLGSSSSLTVGLLNALLAYKGVTADHAKLAKNACEIEIEKLKEPIGKQDQYIASYGGLRYIRFDRDGSVAVENVGCSDDVKRKLEQNLMLFYTGVMRKAGSILKDQREKIPDRLAALDRMRSQAKEVRDCLMKGNVDGVGRILQETWELKKSLAGGISNPEIDGIYEKAIKAGATGGKITGAGGGGFLILYCPAEKQDSVRKALKGLKEVKVRFDAEGSRIICRE